MTNPRDERETENSFSLTQKNKQVMNWQEHAYERLKVLYGVGKLLSYFKTVETTFPQIFALCAETFPFLTAVLIEKRGKHVVTAIWHAANVDQGRTELAVANAKEAFIYLTGTSLPEAANLELDNTVSKELEIRAPMSSEKTNPKNYIVLPLIVDNLPAFGVIQLEGANPLNERDLEFVNALGGLFAVAVDRHFRIEVERDLREKEAKSSLSKLSRTEAHIEGLEAERSLREQFVSLLSHDLRTPLSAAKISAQLIQRQVDISENTMSLAARIVTNVNRADQMITDLLDANRVRSGEQLPLSLEQFDLVALIRDTVEELATVHGDRFQISGLNHIEGYWDRRSLRRIIENLCINAIKYGSSTDPIKISIMEANGNVAVEVQNSGELISHQDQRSLFEQFRRSPKAQGSKKKGWGIGLTLVRGVAEAHGGNVNLISEVAIGTVFTITLPIDARPFQQKET